MGVVRSSPVVLLCPLLVFLVCSGLGLFGVMAALKDAERNERGVATELATDAARHIELQFQQAFSPTITLEIFIQRVPAWSILVTEFPWVASQLLEKVLPGMISNLQLAPNLVVQAIYPLKGNEAAMGHDLLSDQSRYADTIRSLSNRNLTVAGPYKLLQGGTGVLLRKAVFISGVDVNETFGANVSASACPPSLCWDPVTRTKFWGFAQGLARIDGLIEGSDARMQRLMQYGPWHLTRILPNGTETLVAASSASSGCLSGDCVSVDVALPNALWRLYLAKSGGWRPDWRGLMALVVVGSFLVALLLCCLLFTKHRHRALLKAMFPAKVLRPLQQGKNFSEEFESVTILFSDIVSYTSISSSLKPIEVAEMLNELYCLFDDLVDKNGCYKVETIGDAFMVVGGCPLPEPPEVAAERVAQMALDMVATAAGFSSSKGYRLRIRVGVASGPAAAAVIGRKMPRYCLFGDTVNLASRMESTSEPMRIQVSASTAAHLRACASAPSFSLVPRGPVLVKGKGSMECFFLEPAGASGASSAAGAEQHGSSLAGSEPAGMMATRSSRALLRSDASISLGNAASGGAPAANVPRDVAAVQLTSVDGAAGELPGAAGALQQGSRDESVRWASLHLCRIRQERSFRNDSHSRNLTAPHGGAVLSMSPMGSRPSHDSVAGEVGLRGSSHTGLVLGAAPSSGHSGGSLIRALMRGGATLASTSSADAAAATGNADAQRQSSPNGSRNLEAPQPASGPRAIAPADPVNLALESHSERVGGRARSAELAGSVEGQAAGEDQPECGRGSAEGGDAAGAAVAPTTARISGALPVVPSEPSTTSPLPVSTVNSVTKSVTGTPKDVETASESLANLASASFSSPLVREDGSTSKDAH